MITAFVGLGANLGDRRATLAEAVRRLAGTPGVRLDGVSGLYESAAELPAGSSEAAPPFLNAVARLTTALAPRALLWHLLRIEAGLGRRRDPRSIGRTIDLDLLSAGDLVIQELDLVLPHPRLAARAFVIRPLLELSPGFQLPGDDRPLAERGAAPDSACRRLADWGGDDWGSGA